MPKKRVRKSKQTFLGRIIKIRGDAMLFLIIGVAIVAGVLLAGGVYPKLSPDTVDWSSGATIDESTLPNGTDKESLQLQTFKFKECAEIAAIEFLIDSSGSMGDGTKLPNLKSALTAFASKMTDNSVDAMRTFSETTRLVVPFDFYKNNRFSLQGGINSIFPNGGTYTKNAFTATQNDITAAIGNPKFSEYDFSVIFFSDGIPETLEGNQARQGLCTQNSNGTWRCFDESQNPTNEANAIKALKNNSGQNVRIFSILLFDPVRDGFAESRFLKMMEDIASPGSFYQTTDPTQLEAIFDTISSKVCSK